MLKKKSSPPSIYYAKSNLSGYLCKNCDWKKEKKCQERIFSWLINDIWKIFMKSRWYISTILNHFLSLLWYLCLYLKIKELLIKARYLSGIYITEFWLISCIICFEVRHTWILLLVYLLPDCITWEVKHPFTKWGIWSKQ